MAPKVLLNERELLVPEDVSSQRILRSHLQLLSLKWMKPQGTRGMVALRERLKTNNADFLISRLSAAGIGTRCHVEYDGLLRTAVGFHLNGTNFKTFKVILAALRLEEQKLADTRFNIAALQRQIVCQKYRAAGAWLWRHHAELGKGMSSEDKKAIPHHVKMARAAHTLDLVRQKVAIQSFADMPHIRSCQMDLDVSEERDPEPMEGQPRVSRERPYRCGSCGDFVECKRCCLTRHERSPLHDIKVWREGTWERTTLRELGLVYQIGHGGAPSERIRSTTCSSYSAHLGIRQQHSDRRPVLYYYSQVFTDFSKKNLMETRLGFPGDRRGPIRSKDPPVTRYAKTSP
ncbi:hypothetical protein BDZ89DRAFT_1048583 [Hymenopellis radicata]|nr:hypothetical protein BDZ89DRAFT_1048583 [Hymenopellis radicata]